MCPGGDTLSLASPRPGLGSWNLWGLTRRQPWGQEGQEAQAGLGVARRGRRRWVSGPHPPLPGCPTSARGAVPGTAGSPHTWTAGGGRAQAEVSSRLRGFLYQPPFPPPRRSARAAVRRAPEATPEPQSHQPPAGHAHCHSPCRGAGGTLPTPRRGQRWAQSLSAFFPSAVL